MCKDAHLHAHLKKKKQSLSKQPQDISCLWIRLMMESVAFRLLNKWPRWCTLIVQHSLTAQSISKQRERRNQFSFLKIAMDPDGLEGPWSRRTWIDRTKNRWIDREYGDKFNRFKVWGMKKGSKHANVGLHDWEELVGKKVLVIKKKDVMADKSVDWWMSEWV